MHPLKLYVKQYISLQNNFNFFRRFLILAPKDFSFTYTFFKKELFKYIFNTLQFGVI